MANSDTKRYKLTPIGTVKALSLLETGEGFIFYVRVWWGHNPDKSANNILNKAIESIPEPWKNNIPIRAIAGLRLLADNKTSEQALDELVAIETEVNK